MEFTGRGRFVTGGAGFVGSHAAERLPDAGTDVVVTDDFSTGHRGWVPDGATLVLTYAKSHGLTADIFTFANVVGSRLRGAVIPDFVEKLRADHNRLTILGDGHQEKLYLPVTDCVRAIRHVVEHPRETPLRTFNIGTRTTTSVDETAATVTGVFGLDPTHKYTGGDRGWTRDVPKMRLLIGRVLETGWEPEQEGNAAVWRATEQLAREL